MPTDDRAIADFAAGVLLRYFRMGSYVETDLPMLDRNRDIDLLRSHWAISDPVRELMRYLLSHPHEAQGLLRSRQRYDDGIARGRVDARATILRRLLTGSESVIASQEPVRSYETGPNQVVAWVVHSSMRYAQRLISPLPDTSPYRSLVQAVLVDFHLIARMDALREPLRKLDINRRPSAGALREAARSRRPIYRLAVAAYRVLVGLEAGDEAAMQLVIRSSLIAPLENWRRFELAVAMGIGMAIADTVGMPPTLRMIGVGQGEPILTCGRYAVYWQQQTRFYVPPAMEPSEVRVTDVLAAFGIGASSDRPDLVVVDTTEDKVMSIVEVKHLSGDQVSSRFREATQQIVRYARAYSSTDAAMTQLIHNSMIVLSADAPLLLDQTAPAPYAADFSAMQSNALAIWATTRLLSA